MEPQKDKRYHLHEDPESPFLDAGIFSADREDSENQAHLAFLEAESPFLGAFTRQEMTHHRGEENQEQLMMDEMVEKQPSLQPMPLPQECARRLKNFRVAVIGAGLGGLMAAWRLGQHGVKVTLYEARARVGGRVFSNHEWSSGRILEEGAELIGSFHNIWLALARKYGLAVISRMNEELYEMAGLQMKFRLDGNTDLSPQGFHQLLDDIAPIQEDIANLAAREIKDPSRPWKEPNLRQYDAVSVAHILRTRYQLNPDDRRWKALKFLLVNNEVAPLEEMNFLGLLCKVKGGQANQLGTNKPNIMGYWEDLEVFRCADGCQALANSLAKEFEAMPGCKLVRNTAVTEIMLQDPGITLKIRKVTWPAGNLDPQQTKLSDNSYDYVMLAIPPGAWDGVTVTDKGRKVDLKTEVGLIGMGPAVKFFSEMKSRFWLKDKLAPYGGTLTLGQIWEGTDNQTRMGAQGIVLSVFAGPIIDDPQGPHPPREVDMTNELERLYPGYISNRTKALYRDWSTRPFIKTGYSTPKINQIFTVGKKLNEPFRERLFFVGEHTQMAYFGYMEGALRSGYRVAGELLMKSCGLRESSDSPLFLANAETVEENLAFEHGITQEHSDLYKETAYVNMDIRTPGQMERYIYPVVAATKMARSDEESGDYPYYAVEFEMEEDADAECTECDEVDEEMNLETVIESQIHEHDEQGLYSSVDEFASDHVFPFAGSEFEDMTSEEENEYEQDQTEDFVPQVSQSDLRNRIDDYFALANAEYTLPGGTVVSTHPQFKIAKDGDPEKANQTLKKILMKKSGGALSPALQHAIRCAAYGRARPEEIKEITQVLIDAGQFGAISKEYPGLSNKQLIRALQRKFSFGIDCAGYVQLAFMYAFTGKHDHSRCNLTSSKERVQLGLHPKRSWENLANLPSKHFQEVGFLNGQTGDLLVLAWRQGERDWHTVIVVDHTISGNIHTFEVDASWGFMYGQDASGVARRTFQYDESTRVWWDIHPINGTRVHENSIGPYNAHPIKGMYRARQQAS